jgi:hypothetical protein
MQSQMIVARVLGNMVGAQQARPVRLAKGGKTAMAR